MREVEIVQMFKDVLGNTHETRREAEIVNYLEYMRDEIRNDEEHFYGERIDIDHELLYFIKRFKSEIIKIMELIDD